MSDSFSASRMEADAGSESSARFESPSPIEPGATRPKSPTSPTPVAAAPTLTCPACGFTQEPAQECLKCGLVIAKYRSRPAAEPAVGSGSETRSREEIANDLAVQRYQPRERVATDDDDDGFFAPERRGLDKGILGGVVIMAIAVVWFGLGWMAGYIFFYPPILFLIGLFGMLKGIFSGNVAG